MILALTACSNEGDKKLDFENQTTRINYSLGYQVGGDFKRQGVEMDTDAVVQGIRDALSETQPQMQPDEMHATLVELKRQVVSEERAARRANELTFVKEGEAFLAANAKKAGVVTTPSGLQYRIVDPGSGTSPSATDQVTVNYVGTLTNGQEFDSGEGTTFRLNGVIRGWTEGLQHIGEGGRIELFVPPQLAYADRGPLANRTLIFDVELLSVEAPAS